MLDKIKQLLNEEIIIPTIKFLSFSPVEIERWKDADCINIIRKKSDINNLMLEDLIKTEWNKIYKIVDIQLYNDLEDFPYLRDTSKFIMNFDVLIHIIISHYSKVNFIGFIFLLFDLCQLSCYNVAV